VFDRTKGRDGYVSLEVTLAEGDDRAAIVREARHLRQAVDAPNVLIKVPGTKEGVAAFEALTGEGLNVNVTLLFAVATYAQVAEAYLAGLEAFARNGGDLSKAPASRASSSAGSIPRSTPSSRRRRPTGCSGRSRSTTRRSPTPTTSRSSRARGGRRSRRRGARPQRVLWASTSTKNKRYRDVLYVEELVGKDTVNTAPPATIDAFRDHGRARLSIGEDLEGARARLASLGKLGIDLDDVTDRLLEEASPLLGRVREAARDDRDPANGDRAP
jgi:transaldolase